LAEELQEENVFDVIWFPQGFLIDEGVYQRSLKTLYRALKPGGLLLSVALPDDPGTAAVAKFVFSLCVADRSVQVLTDDFSKVGFENIEVLTIKDSIAPIIASKPQ